MASSGERYLVSVSQSYEMRKLVDGKRFPKISAALQSLAPSANPGGYAATRGDLVTIDGQLTLDIRDFGVKPPQMFMMKADPVVQVTLHLVASKAA